MNLGRAIYTSLSYLFPVFARVAGLFNKKVAKGVKARKRVKNRWLDKAAALSREKKIVWFHVSSVGEFLQAKPVISLLHSDERTDIQVALTFFSPSGINQFERFSGDMEDDSISFLEYLPVDTPSNARFCLDTLNPDLIVYVKFDLWPNLLYEAFKRQVPQILISATLAPSSKRLNPLARKFYGDVYSLLGSIAAISGDDAERFAKYSGGGDISVAGDTRFDQVCLRIDSPERAEIPPVERAGGDIIIAGSTWPEDEKIVIPGFRMISGGNPDSVLVLAPHEPTSSRLSEISSFLTKEGLSFRMLSEIEESQLPAVPVIVADGVGYLAELYRKGVLAYVGGSFTTGVHNVMEPSVLSLPVFFGPRIDNSLEALKLVEIGSGSVVTSPEEFSSGVSRLLADRPLLREKGERGSKFIRSNCGASRKCLDLIVGYLNER